MRRRWVGIAVVVIALALPVLAFGAVTREHDFRLPNGFTKRTFLVHMTKTGRLKVLFHFSDVRNPHGHFVVTLQKAGWKEDVLLIDTDDRSGCNGAAGTIYCSVNRAMTTKGWYKVLVGKSTKPAASVSLTTTRPS
jgi:hypothetical protein